MKKINIVKIGSDSINKKNLKRIIEDAWEWENKTWEKFIFISSGAVKMGRERVKEVWKNDTDFSTSSLASIGQQFLMQMYDTLSGDKKIVSEILLDDFADEKYLAKTLYNLLENNIWIIINYNDSLHPNELENVSEKTDNDRNTVFISQIIQKYLTKKIMISRVIYLTNTSWLLDWEKKTIKWWKISSSSEKEYYKSFVEEWKSSSWTGGMKSKLDCSFLVWKYGAKSAIIADAQHGLTCLAWKWDYTEFNY